MASRAAAENQATLLWPCGMTMKAASSGPDRGAAIAADLEDALRKAEAAAGGEPRDTGGFGMEHAGAEADEAGGKQQRPEMGGVGEQDEAAQGRAHAAGERIGQRAAVGVDADQRLQQRGGDLEGEGDQADLAEIERVVLLEDRVDGRQQRLDHVVEQMGEADGEEDGERRGAAAGGRSVAADPDMAS